MGRLSISAMGITRARNALWSAAALFVVVEGMKQGKEVLLPIAFAILLAIIASPGVSWLRRRKVPKVVAVLLVVAGMMASVAGLALLVGGSIASFKSAVPQYQKRLAVMVYELFKWLDAHGGPADAGRLLEMVEPGAAAGEAWNFIGDSVSALGSALSNTLVVVLTMVLILLEGDTVPGRLRALAGDPQADISPYQRIATEVQAYLFIKTVLSLATGILIAIWARVLGVHFALLWGLIAFLLNYIPNIGSIVAAVPAMLLALIQHGPGTSLALGAGYVVVNMVIGNVIEPMWMGRKLGLSTTVVFLSLIVWQWIWGNAGMLLSVPLTMVIKIMLENSKEWSFLAQLLGPGNEEPDTEERPPMSIAPASLRGLMRSGGAAVLVRDGPASDGPASSRPGSNEPTSSAPASDRPVSSRPSADRAASHGPVSEPPDTPRTPLVATADETSGERKQTPVPAAEKTISKPSEAASDEHEHTPAVAAPTAESGAKKEAPDEPVSS